MVNDIYGTEGECFSWRWSLQTWKKRKLHQFALAGSLYFVAPDIQGPLSKANGGNKHTFVITGCYSKRTKTTLTIKTTATNNAHFFMEHLVARFRIPSTVSMDNIHQSNFKLFATLCGEHGVKSVASTEYYLQSKRQVERLKTTMIQDFDTTRNNTKRTRSLSCSFWCT